MSSMMVLVDNNRTDKNAMLWTGHSYMPTYNRLLSPMRETAKCVGEVGVQRGGSIKLWNDFFVNAKVVGIDIMPKTECWDQLLALPRVQLFLESDAYNPAFVAANMKQFKFDFLLDDGSHKLEDIQSFIRLYLPLMAANGVMIIEDLQKIEWGETLHACVPQRFKHCAEVVDLRNLTGRWDDIFFMIDLRKMSQPVVVVAGLGGLGNCLFQIASAAHYAHKHNREMVLYRKSENLIVGTSQLGRNKCLKDPCTGENVTYDKTIFKKFRFVDDMPADAQVFNNNYGADYPEWQCPDEKSLVVSGYQQHRDLLNFSSKSSSVAWLSVDDKNYFKHLTDKYAHGDSEFFNNCVILCIRRGQDFANMTKLTNKLYNDVLKKHFPSDKFTYLIVSDCETLLENIAPLKADDEILSAGLKHSKMVLVNEPDIVQFHLSRLCKNIIVSESTFHCWMAYFVGLTFSQPRIVCFQDTDLITRNLHLNSWIIE